MTQVGITAIETRYAGCRFRSRLEARWAVFLDYLGIMWEYESQGYHVTQRLTLGDSTFPYLPDFWLPMEKLHMEVKGSLTPAECVRLVDAAASLSSNNGGGCHDDGGHDVLIAGRLDATSGTPLRMHMHKGDLKISSWNPLSDGAFGDGCPDWPGPTIASDYGGDAIFGLTPAEVVADVLLGGATPPTVSMRRALGAARSARFEHGEQG